MSDLKFKTVNEGLGFHPFSNGLPYAPISKKPAPQKTAVPLTQTTPTTHIPPRPSKPMGTGAEAAGIPRFITPPSSSSSPRINVPVAPQKQPISPVQTAFTEKFGATYLMRRVAAYILDSIIHLTLTAAIIGFGLWKTGTTINVLSSLNSIAALAIFTGLFHWALMTAQEVVLHTTLGKRAFGLKVSGTPGRLFMRSLLSPVSIAFFGVGLIWAMFDPDRRCWHDMATGVQPTELTRL